METVHAVWIGSDLSLLEQLSIKLFQRHQYRFKLWLYDECSHVPEGVELADANRILPRSSIFGYQGKTNKLLPNLGSGSVAHWSDQFQLKLLYQEGGIYTQLDVTLLGKIPSNRPYLFVRDAMGAQCFLMKCPQGSPFALETFELLQREINGRTFSSISWLDSMRLIGRAISEFQLEHFYLANWRVKNGIDFSAVRAPFGSRVIHWWNASLGLRKNDPISGSLYERLLIKTGLYHPTNNRTTSCYGYVAQ